MSRILSVLFIVLCASCVAEDAKDALPEFPAPVCLGDRLRQTKAGFFLDEKVLAINPTPELQASAAYYEKDGMLVTVSSNVTIRLYETKDGKIVEKSLQEGSPTTSLNRVNFTRVPGLAYVEWTDLKIQAELKENPMRQLSPKGFARIALTDVAKKFGALRSNPGDELFSVCYLLTDALAVPLSLKEGNWTKLELVEKLRQTEGSGGPCIFVFEKKGLVCQTEKGWSLNALNGKLVKHFPAESVNAVWWEAPTLEVKGFVVHARFGPNFKDYLLNVEIGKMDELH